MRFHVAPASVERNRCPSALEPPPAAIRVPPSAEEATLTQLESGAVVCIQFKPELVETKIGPPEPLPWLATTSRVPSAEEATAVNA